MKIRSAEFCRIFEEGGYPAFCCSSDFNVIKLNQCFTESDLPFSIGESVYLTMQNKKDADFFSDALARLSVGLPFFSTNFDIFRHIPVFILPASFTEPDSEGYIFILLWDTPAIFPSIGNAMHSLADKYRSPIFDIVNITHLLSRRLEKVDDYSGLDYLSTIVRNCYTMLRSTSSVQTYFKLVNGRQRFYKEALLFTQHISATAKAISRVFAPTKYQLSFDICQSEALVFIDGELINLALFHLIANACIFSPADAKIHILLSFEDDFFTIVIRDEGDGIPAANMTRIFEPFFSHHSSPVPDEYIGIGLGLPIAKRIIEEHKGTIFLKSSLNQGTDVIIRIPVASLSDYEATTLNSSERAYETSGFSDINLIFSDICDIKL